VDEDDIVDIDQGSQSEAEMTELEAMAEDSI